MDREFKCGCCKINSKPFERCEAHKNDDVVPNWLGMFFLKLGLSLMYKTKRA